MPNATESIGLMFLAWFLVLLVVMVAALTARAMNQRTKFRQPNAPNRVPWDGWLVLIVFLIGVLTPSLMQGILLETGFFSARYGTTFPLVRGEDGLSKQAENLRGLWAQFFSVPLELLCFTIILGKVYQTQLRDLGLERRRWPAGIWWGSLGWVIITPVTFLLWIAATAVLVQKETAHPLTQLGPWAGRLEWIVFALDVTVLVPILEEFLFRGVLLLWLLKPTSQSASNMGVPLEPRRRADVIYLIAVMLSVQTISLGNTLQQQRWGETMRLLAPFWFVILLLPGYLLLPQIRWVRRKTRLRSAQEVRAIFASSLLFAIIHMNVWPSPVPLFWFALCLGYIVTRTRSLLSAVYIHGCFNAVSAFYLMLGGTP